MTKTMKMKVRIRRRKTSDTGTKTEITKEMGMKHESMNENFGRREKKLTEKLKNCECFR
jgi:hypothetical protein